MVAYARRSDVYKYGLPRGLLANPGRICASVLAATDEFELDGHGLETDDPFIARAEQGGSLPSPLVAGTTYYAVRVNEQYFKAAAAPSGSVIDLTTDGALVVIATPLPFDDVLEFYSRFADQFFPANALPLNKSGQPVPVTVVALVAELTANKLLQLAGQESKNMAELEIGARAQLERFAKGLPIRDANASVSSAVAYSETAPSVGARNWTPEGGTLP